MKTNMESLKVGMEVIEMIDGVKEKIVELTSNSFLITRTKRSENGINCEQWFTVGDFDRYFRM